MVVGDTVTLEPEPTAVPPQDALYHCQEAPTPKDPPLTVKVEELPEQIVVALAKADVGAVEFELTVTVTLTQAVVLHVPVALTK